MVKPRINVHSIKGPQTQIVIYQIILEVTQALQGEHANSSQSRF